MHSEFKKLSACYHKLQSKGLEYPWAVSQRRIKWREQFRSYWKKSLWYLQVHKETNTGLGLTQKQPHSNVSVHKSNAEADKRKHKTTKNRLTLKPDFEEKDT